MCLTCGQKRCIMKIWETFLEGLPRLSKPPRPGRTKGFLVSKDGKKGAKMANIVFNMIVGMMKKENAYLAYTVRYKGDEKDTLIFVPHENYESHIRYLWDFFFMDGNAYNSKSPVRFIHNFIMCDKLSEIEDWLKWQDTEVDGWM